MKKKNKKNFVKTVKELQKEISKLCPEADKISVLHLSIAISKKYKCYLTSDQCLLEKAKTLKRKYNIFVTGSLYESQEFLSKKKPQTTPFSFYL